MVNCQHIQQCQIESQDNQSHRDGKNTISDIVKLQELYDGLLWLYEVSDSGQRAACRDAINEIKGLVLEIRSRLFTFANGN